MRKNGGKVKPPYLNQMESWSSNITGNTITMYNSQQQQLVAQDTTPTHHDRPLPADFQRTNPRLLSPKISERSCFGLVHKRVWSRALKVYPAEVCGYYCICMFTSKSVESTAAGLSTWCDRPDLTTLTFHLFLRVMSRSPNMVPNEATKPGLPFSIVFPWLHHAAVLPIQLYTTAYTSAYTE